MSAIVSLKLELDGNHAANENKSQNETTRRLINSLRPRESLVEVFAATTVRQALRSTAEAGLWAPPPDPTEINTHLAWHVISVLVTHFAR
jgi:hypothetical protein